MDFSHLNSFDAVVLGIMGLSCLFAFFRGLVREILSLAAWIGAGIVTLEYFPQVAEKLQAHFKSPMVAAGVATVGLYIGALIVFAILNRIIIKTIQGGGETGMLDNLLGLCFGAFRGALIISLAFFLITNVVTERNYPDWLKNAQTLPYAKKGADTLARVAPEYLDEIAKLQKKATAEVESNRKSSASSPYTNDNDNNSN